MSAAPKQLRLRKLELFEYLGYKPHPGQLEVHKSTAGRRILACGSRWGKSTLAAYEALAALLEPRESSLGWIVAPSYDLADRIFRIVRQEARKTLEHRILVDDERDHRLVLQNLGGGKSEVRGKSADKPASLLGEGLDWLILDEAARVKEEVWERHLRSRLVGRKSWALLVSVPRGHSWFFRMYALGQRRAEADYQSWRKPTWDNPLIDPAAIEAERAVTPEEVFRAEYGAEFIGTDPLPCETCGGPSRTAVGVHQVRSLDEVKECVECGGLVDRRGRTIMLLVPGYAPYVKIVRVQEGPCWKASVLEGLVDGSPRSGSSAG